MELSKVIEKIKAVTKNPVCVFVSPNGVLRATTVESIIDSLPGDQIVGVYNSAFSEESFMSDLSEMNVAAA